MPELKLAKMKYLLLLLLAGCASQSQVVAPVTTTIKTPTYLEQEIGYKPPVVWNVENFTAYMDYELAKGNYLSYRLGAIIANFTQEDDKLRFDCSNGMAGIFTCLDNGYVSVSCERMNFKINCSAK